MREGVRSVVTGGLVMDGPIEHGHSPEAIRSRLANSGHRGHLRDVVYGAIDGAVTTFAIVAGVQAAGLSTAIIVTLGVANILADGFSMAVGNYAGTKAELDNIERLRAVEERHLALDPEGEREEVRQILSAKGLEGRVLEEATAAVTRRHDTWIELMLAGEYGLSSTPPSPGRAAGATFFAFLAAGSVPLLPFALGFENAFSFAITATGAVFFAIGSLKSRWSPAPWWRSGLETLAIGAVAASIAFYVGGLF